MAKQQVKTPEKTGLEGVTTVPERYASMKTMIDNYGKLYDVPVRVISEYLPSLPGARTKYLYQILLAVARLKEPSKAKVIQTLCAGNRSALQAIDHLEQCGYIRAVDKPRLIKPFGKYKIDTGYVITSQGLQALQQIIAA